MSELNLEILRLAKKYIRLSNHVYTNGMQTSITNEIKQQETLILSYLKIDKKDSDIFSALEHSLFFDRKEWVVKSGTLALMVKRIIWDSLDFVKENTDYHMMDHFSSLNPLISKYTFTIVSRANFTMDEILSLFQTYARHSDDLQEKETLQFFVDLMLEEKTIATNKLKEGKEIFESLLKEIQDSFK